MSSTLLTPPAMEPLTLAEAKAWLRLDTNDEDATVSALIAAARFMVELAIQRQLIHQTWRISLDCWPADGLVRLPLMPAVSIAAVRVWPASGGATTVSPTAYRLETTRDPALLVLTGAVMQPGLPRGGIEIDLVCGMSAAASGVPEPLRQAVRLLVARWFEHRGDEAGDSASLPPDVAMLTAPFRRPRL